MNQPGISELDLVFTGERHKFEKGARASEESQGSKEAHYSNKRTQAARQLLSASHSVPSEHTAVSATWNFPTVSQQQQFAVF